jgi:ParB family chromosome partitioning protein
MATRKPKGLGRGLDALLGADAQVIGALGVLRNRKGSRPR